MLIPDCLLDWTQTIELFLVLSNALLRTRGRDIDKTIEEYNVAIKKSNTHP